MVSVSGATASRLPDFTALSKQLALATPSLTSETAYTPSNSAAQVCPMTGADWAASSNLPPTVNSGMCDCLLSSLSCVANAGLTGEETASLFAAVCGLENSACDGISSKADTGIYGPFSMCDARTQLSFAMHQYYQIQKQAPAACDFNGNAQVQSPSARPSCSPLLGKVGFQPFPWMTVTAAATHTKKSAAGAVLISRSEVGLLQLGASLLIAGLAGAMLILL